VSTKPIALQADAQDHDLDQLVEDDPVGDLWAVTLQGMGHDMFRDQRGELVPHRVDDA